jgi:prophage antirepressor-like protein
MAKGELELVLTVPADATANGFTRLEVFGTTDRPMWAADDIGAVLGYTNIRKALASLEPDERGVTERYRNGYLRKITVVNEAGLFSLLFTSRVPSARRFRRWVLWDVLPSIRRYGCYPPPKNAVESPPPGAGWVDVVRAMTDGQSELASGVMRVDRAIAEVAEKVELIGRGLAAMMTREQPAAPALPLSVVPHRPSEPMMAAIRNELSKDPARTDTVVVRVIEQADRLKVSTISQSCRTMSSVMRNIEGAPLSRPNRKGRPASERPSRAFRRWGRLETYAQSEGRSPEGCRQCAPSLTVPTPLSNITLDTGPPPFDWLKP